MDATDLEIVIDVLLENLLLCFIGLSPAFDLDVKKFDLLVDRIIGGLLAQNLLLLLLIV